MRVPKKRSFPPFCWDIILYGGILSDFVNLLGDSSRSHPGREAGKALRSTDIGEWSFRNSPSESLRVMVIALSPRLISSDA